MVKPPGAPAIGKLTDLYDNTRASATGTKEQLPPPRIRIRNAIRELNEAGESLRNADDLVRFLLEATERVQRGEDGFDLSKRHTVAGDMEEIPSDATRVYYGGRAADPTNPANPDPASSVKSRVMAEHLANWKETPDHAVLTLESIGYAAIIDRLGLWERDMIEALRERLESAVLDRPELANKFTNEEGEIDAQLFAAHVWKEGLSTQYAREANGQVWVVVTAPYDGQTWFEDERPALLANGKVKPEDISYVGFTHEPFTAAAKARGEEPVPLAHCTPPMTDQQAMPYIQERWQADKDNEVKKGRGNHGQWTTRKSPSPEPVPEERTSQKAEPHPGELAAVFKMSLEVKQKSKNFLGTVDEPTPVSTDYVPETATTKKYENELPRRGPKPPKP